MQHDYTDCWTKNTVTREKISHRLPSSTEIAIIGCSFTAWIQTKVTTTTYVNIWHSCFIH